MISGAPDAARWVRSEPRRTLPAPVLERMVQSAFPGRRVVDMQALDDGWRNANFKLTLDSSGESIVLRVYEHDASLCQKEVDLIRLMGQSVPVPEVIHAQPRAVADVPPFAFLRYIEGMTFRELARSADIAAIAQAADSAGETLAAISRVMFSKSGWLAPGPTVTVPLIEGADPVPRFIDVCLAAPNLQERMPAELRDRTRTVVWSYASQLASLDRDMGLVHGDFGKRNLIVKRVAGRWSVAAVLDWEFAVSGCPLADVGHFLRYERSARPVAEPHFSAGYLRVGGRLPPDWRRLARLVDLTALCESLTHDQLPESVVTELVELVHATIENRDPR